MCKIKDNGQHRVTTVIKNIENKTVACNGVLGKCHIFFKTHNANDENEVDNNVSNADQNEQNEFAPEAEEIIISDRVLVATYETCEDNYIVGEWIVIDKDNTLQ